jgi:hypothetical protein
LRHSFATHVLEQGPQHDHDLYPCAATWCPGCPEPARWALSSRHSSGPPRTAAGRNAC